MIGIRANTLKTRIMTFTTSIFYLTGLNCIIVIATVVITRISFIIIINTNNASSAISVELARTLKTVMMARLAF